MPFLHKYKYNESERKFKKKTKKTPTNLCFYTLTHIDLHTLFNTFFLFQEEQQAVSLY